MRNVPVETSTSNALVSQCDVVGSYDWSFQEEEEPTNYALMAFTSSSSSSFDNEVASCSKACTKAYTTLQSHKLTNDLRKSQFDVLSYKTGLESVEARILVYQQNENVFEEDIKLLKLDVQLRDNALVELRKKFKKAEQERDELKLKLDKFQTSSKNLSQLLACQNNDKTRLGYDNQVFNSSVFDCDEIFSSKSDVSDSEDDSEGEPMPIQKATSFVQTTEHVKTPRPSVKTVEHPIPADNLRKDISKSRGHSNSKNRKACFVCKSLTYLIKDCDYYEKNGSKACPKPCYEGRSSAFFKDDTSQSPKAWNMSYLSDFDSLILKTFITGIENQLNLKVKIIKSDNETKFKNQDLNHFYRMKGIKREFSVARTPQYNGIAKRKNMTLIEAARTMLADSLLPIPFWAKAVNTACYVQNMVLVTKPHNKTPYKLLLGRTPSIGFMRPFGYFVTIINTLDPLGKFDGKANEGFLVGYSVSNPQNTDDDTTFEVKEPKFKVKEFESAVHVSPSHSVKTKKHDDKSNKEAKVKSLVKLSIGVRNLSEEFEDFTDNSTNEVNAASTPVPAVEQNSSNSTNTFSVVALEDITYSDDEEDVGAEADFSNLETTPQTRSMTRMVKDQGGLNQINNEDFHTYMFACFISQEEPKRVWVLVDLPKGKRAIGSKWVFRNKKDEKGIVIRNKARLVTQGHTQEECIDYEEFFAPVTRIEAIRLFLAYTSFIGFMVYQMDVKSAFLYETITEKVYVCQPPGFEDPDYPDKVYKVVKALYGLHQAPRAWYETLANYLLENGFQRGKIDQTLFIKKQKDGKPASTPIDTEKPLLKDPHGKDVDVHTYRSMIGSLMYLTSSRTDIMFAVCACSHFQVTPKASHLHAVKRIFSCCKLLHLSAMDSKSAAGLWEIFTELARIGYEKPFTKLTFYEAFFSAQWKFLIHIILQCMGAKRTSWNEFSSSMASVVICLATGRKFNFSKYIFHSLVRNVDSSSKFYMYPRFLHLMISAQIADLSSHTTKYTSLALTQKVFANIRRVVNGFSRVDTPLFKGMLVPQQAADDVVDDVADDVVDVVADDVAADEIVDVVTEDAVEPTPPSPTLATIPPPPQQEVTSTPPPSPHQSHIAQPSSPPP
nr:hypothetical protein [Tanacetum cinerariifolium]